MKIGFIGAGNMGRAIIRGLLQAKFVPAKHVFASGRNMEKLSAFCKANGLRACENNEDLVGVCDVVVVAVKPAMFARVLPPLAETFFRRKPLVISVAAGTSLATISALVGGDSVPVVRAMPNVAAGLGLSMTALCASPSALGHVDVAREMFATVGRVMEIEESLFSAFSAVACASPAFAFLFVEALAKAGLREGLTKEQSTLAAAQAVYGSAKMLLEQLEHPAVLADRVCSPGGTTIEGVAALEQRAFTATVMEAVAAAVKKDRAMLEKQ